MKQHSVPENIMDVEFKLFGSLSAKQFGYIIAGGFIALFFFYFFKSLGVMLLGWIFAFLCVILGLSLALIRINEQPFEIWLGNFIAAMFTSQKRVWKKEKKTPDSLNSKKIEPQKQLPQQLTPRIKTKSQQTIVQTTPKDESVPMPEHPFKDISREKDVSSTQKMQQSTVTPTKINGDELQNNQLAGKPVKGQVQYIPGTAQKYMTMTTNQTPNRPIDMSQSINKQQGGLSNNSSNLNSMNMQDVANSQLQGTSQPSNVKNDVGTNGVQQNINQTANDNIPINKQTYMNKANQYSDLVPSKVDTIEQGKQKDTAEFQNIPKESTDDKLEEENKALRQKVAEFSEEKGRLEQELETNKGMYTQLQEQNMQINQQIKQLQTQMQQMQTRPVPQPKARKVLPVDPNLSKKAIQDEQTGILSPKVYQGPSLSKKPNVISGIVRTKDGKLLPGVVVIVKNDKSRPVRAMKTNSLGQFITTTSLEDGIYVIELSKEDYSFGRFEVKLSGDVLPTYEFVAY